MSSGSQELNKKTYLKEYEKDYLARLEKEVEKPKEVNNPKESEEKKIGDLQDIIYQMAKEFQEHEKKEYIGNCIACNKKVERQFMVYKNNHLFHSECFENQGNKFPSGNQELQKQTSNAKVQLVLLKNLKSRTTSGSKSSTTNDKPKKLTQKNRTSKRSTKRRTAKRNPSKKRRKGTQKSKKRKTSKRKVGGKNSKRTKRRKIRRLKKVRKRTKRPQ